MLAGCGGDGGDGDQSEVTLGTRTAERPATAPQSKPKPVPRTETAPEPRAPVSRPGPRRPAITAEPIPFDARRTADTAAYSQRHYGEPLTRLDPKVIVEHFSVIPTASATVDSFRDNEPDGELGELPGLCAHFVVDRDGTILQLVSLDRICRHAVGLNDVAIGIEHVGASDAEVLGNRPQLAASLRLTAWLRCRFGIEASDVIGHAESLSSPHHHELVPELKTQTHDDLQPETMERYRALLARRPC